VGVIKWFKTPNVRDSDYTTVSDVDMKLELRDLCDRDGYYL
jgi:hypothetical protein